MTIYISGAITGLPNNNKPAFQNAYSMINQLRNCFGSSLHVINPQHIGARVRRAFAGKEPQWSDYMRACIKKLCEADCVFFLPDWAQSEGATLERHIAKRLNIPLADNIDELKKIMEAVK
jgi:hypothetical protein